MTESKGVDVATFLEIESTKKSYWDFWFSARQTKVDPGQIIAEAPDWPAR
jgi:hypothetical protein